MCIRHYGITANRHRERKLQRARELLGGGQVAPPASDPPTPTAAAATTSSAADAPAKVCPRQLRGEAGQRRSNRR